MCSFITVKCLLLCYTSGAENVRVSSVYFELVRRSEQRDLHPKNEPVLKLGPLSAAGKLRTAVRTGMCACRSCLSVQLHLALQ